ncbi:GatB/YqeY domain-containing protein [Candidatus Saccharibacteria bacterium]|nr:GatB/YqeY domain-containing protein [Candidatus Saccharibacteria bacterium]
MALHETIQNDLKAALLGGDRFKVDVLRNLRAAVLAEEVTQNKREVGLSDDEIEKIIAKEVKKRAESIKLYEENGRPELAESERLESGVLQEYLPSQLSESEVSKIVEQTIDEMGAKGMQAMGLVIKTVKEKVGNTADGSLIARLVKEQLQ